MRRPISSQKRYSILERDNFCCQVCGASAPNVTLHVDHIISVVEGGSNEDENLRAICITCNLGKGSKSAPKKRVQYPIRISDKDVHCRGEQLSEPIFWIGEQWAVTASGIEARDGTYFIAKDRVFEKTGAWCWENHMAAKIWVNRSDFQAAINWARQNHQMLMATTPTPPAEESAA